MTKGILRLSPNQGMIDGVLKEGDTDPSYFRPPFFNEFIHFLLWILILVEFGVVVPAEQLLKDLQLYCLLLLVFETHHKTSSSTSSNDWMSLKVVIWENISERDGRQQAIMRATNVHICVNSTPFSSCEKSQPKQKVLMTRTLMAM